MARTAGCLSFYQTQRTHTQVLQSLLSYQRLTADAKTAERNRLNRARLLVQMPGRGRGDRRHHDTWRTARRRVDDLPGRKGCCVLGSVHQPGASALERPQARRHASPLPRVGAVLRRRFARSRGSRSQSGGRCSTTRTRQDGLILWPRRRQRQARADTTGRRKTFSTAKATQGATWELKAKKVDTLDWRRVRAAIGSSDSNRDAAFDKQLGNDLLNEEERQSVDRRILSHKHTTYAIAEPDGSITVKLMKLTVR